MLGKYQTFCYKQSLLSIVTIKYLQNQLFENPYTNFNIFNIDLDIF